MKVRSVVAAAHGAAWAERVIDWSRACEELPAWAAWKVWDTLFALCVSLVLFTLKRASAAPRQTPLWRVALRVFRASGWV